MQDDIARLMSWNAEGFIPQEAFERVQNHPRYCEAVRSFSSGVLAASLGDKALDGIAKDVGRYVGAQWAIYLHVSGGLTLPRLKEVCAMSGLLSPGRARAVLIFLRYLGYVVPAADRPSGGAVRYVPTPSLLRAWARLVRAGLQSVRLVEPAADLVLAHLEDREVLERFLYHQGAGFLATSRALPETAFFRVFLHRHAGMQTLHWMIDAAAKAGDGFPPRQPIGMAIASVARQLRVSRTHVKRLLDDGEREGLLTRADENSVLFTEQLAHDSRFVISGLMIGMLICAARTAHDVLELRAQRFAGIALAH